MRSYLMKGIAFLLSVFTFVIICSLFSSEVLADYRTSTLSFVFRSSYSWIFWIGGLFLLSFLIGLVAVIGGVGGGVLYVPLVSSFFPFHLDFIRAAGLLVALSASVAAGPKLLEKGLANLRLAIPIALITSITAIIGALVGLTLPSKVIQLALGGIILSIVVILLRAKKSDYPDNSHTDYLARALQLHGIYFEESKGDSIEWKVHHTLHGFLTFIFVGFLAGMFGLGAGWANVPILNLLMGAPLKVAVGTSMLLLSITDSAAAWIYITNGALIPMIILPSIIGVMLGSKVGVRLLTRFKPHQVRYLIIAILLFAGVRSFMKGLGF